MRLEALLKVIARNRRLPLTQLKWRLCDLVGLSSPHNLGKRTKENMQRDIAEVTSFAKARDFLERLLDNFDVVYLPSHRGSTGGTVHVGSKKSRSGNRVVESKRSRSGD